MKDCGEKDDGCVFLFLFRNGGLGNVGALSPDGIPEMELKRWSEIHRFEMVKVMFRAC